MKKLKVMEPCDHRLIGKNLLLYPLPFFSLQDNIMIFGVQVSFGEKLYLHVVSIV